MAASSLLLFSLCIAIQIFTGFADKLFLSIDCGERGTRTDNLGIKWVGDGGYIIAGETAVVPNLGSYRQELKSLRFFPSQKKSCYLIPGVVRGSKHMIRATFFYGNYDNKLSPPSFALQFDRNPWVTVNTSSSEAQYFEVIYAPKRKNISICVAHISPDQVPFISALEIREFETGMYQTNSEQDTLIRHRRIAFGSIVYVRYPNDPYDRFWHPSGAIDGMTILANTSYIPNFRDIPGLALAHAITPAQSNATVLTVPSSNLRLVDDLYYYIFYFSEMSQAAYRNKSRSFDFHIDGVKLNNDTIVPAYGSYTTDYTHGRALNAGSVISLVNTPDASLPPVLNAMELFIVRSGLANGTDENDVKALEVVLQGHYQQLQSWLGDPCLPPEFPWDWLNCNNDDPPRVIELHLYGSVLKGFLPDFSSLNALEIIDLSNNSLNGQIPEFLGRFPYLKELSYFLTYLR